MGYLNKWLAAFLAVALTCVMTPVTAQDKVDLSARWTGTCDTCVVNSFILDVKQVGETISGTIQTSGAQRFGDAPKAISGGNITGSKIKFDAKGDWGDPLSVELSVAPDGRTLQGKGYFMGTNFGLKFVRSSGT